VAHTVSPAPRDGSAGATEPSVGTLVQSAMADFSTLVRGEIELAKAEVGKAAKKAGIGAGAFGAAGVVLAFSAFFFFIALAEFLTWLGLQRWISYLIVWFALVLVAGLAALVGRRFIKKIEKPERTIETLHDLPEVLHREAPGQRHRAVPEITNGRVQRQGNESYTL
jgi:membrane protein implicated in regulation of membrane protease activity